MLAAALLASRRLLQFLLRLSVPHGALPLPARIPMDRLLLETDAPAGSPRLSGKEAAQLVPAREPSPQQAAV